MIIVETIDEGTRERRYSDKGVKIRKVGTDILYDDAVDIIPCRYEYEETDISIDIEEIFKTEDDNRHRINDIEDIIADMLFGGDEEWVTQNLNLW